MGLLNGLAKVAAAVAPSKQYLVSLECYIWGQVAPKCVLPLRDRKQDITTYEMLTVADSVAVPAVFYLRAKNPVSHPKTKQVSENQLSYFPITVHCTKCAWNTIREAPLPSAPVSGGLSPLKISKDLSWKTPISA